ncbi:MAG: hypothetical protein IRZ16_23105 [Myxococcaceae bacterium]|nr:hypothetical protein [Myxococcaceae bacterium]
MSLPVPAAEALGPFGGPGQIAEDLGRVAFVAALGTTGVIERIQYRLREKEAKTWWASNSRDVLNAAAFGVLWIASGMIGFPGPLCLLISATVLVLLNVLQAEIERTRHATILSVTVAVLLGLPVAIVPRAVDAALREAVTFLFR